MLASIVYVAERLAAQEGYGFRGDLPSLDIDRGILADLGFTDAHIASVRTRLPEGYQDIEATFG
jgi:hypothetical protein